MKGIYHDVFGFKGLDAGDIVVGIGIHWEIFCATGCPSLFEFGFAIQIDDV